MVVSAFLLSLGCWFPALSDDGATSKSLSFATFKEEAGRVTVIVGSQLTGHYGQSPYAPLQIAVGAYGDGPTLVVTPASFALIDARGVVYPMAPYPEVRDAEVILFVKQLDRAVPLVTGDSFLGRARVSSIFYPQSGAPAGKERVELTHRTYFKDTIYFPRPENGWTGVLTLQFVARGLDEPIRVRFTVPGLREAPGS
jgi:hypothetical protein